MGAWTLGWANAILFCFAEEPPCCFLLDVGPCAKAPKKCDIFEHTSQNVHSENPLLSFHCYYSLREVRMYLQMCVGMSLTMRQTLWRPSPLLWLSSCLQYIPLALLHWLLLITFLHSQPPCLLVAKDKSLLGVSHVTMSKRTTERQN
uniref:Secreted protein n=1 Tax=Rhipicephalus appendiculatus TaxID=34631 RepID=A0A131YCI5_RHIAP